MGLLKLFERVAIQQISALQKVSEAALRQLEQESKRIVALEQRERDLIGQWEGAKLDWVVERDRADALEQRERESRLGEAEWWMKRPEFRMDHAKDQCHSTAGRCACCARIAELRAGR